MTETTATCTSCGKVLPPRAINAEGQCFLCVAESFGFGGGAPPPSEAPTAILPPAPIPEAGGPERARELAALVAPSRAELEAAAARQSAHAARLRSQTEAVERAKGLGIDLGLALIEAAIKAAPYLVQSVDQGHDLDQAARTIRDHGVQLLRLDRVPGF